jgi:hypothetical protein
MSGLFPPLTAKKKKWYETEKNTSALIRSVVSSRSIRNLSGEQIHNLITLTWITKSRKRESTDHWKKYKVPALASLFNEDRPNDRADLSATIDAMKLPTAVAKSAKRKTGMINFRNPWRKSSLGWCKKNQNDLRKTIRDAANLSISNGARLDLAARIDELPDVMSGHNQRPLTPERLLTPLIACLDPHCRFPIVNGREAVKSLLRKQHLAHDDLRHQVQGLIGIMGRKDAFRLDVQTDEIIRQELEKGRRTKRAAWQQPPSTDPIIYKRAARLVKVERTEAKMEEEIKKTLAKQYGKKAVEAQRDFRDLTLTTPNRRALIEIKASQDARQAIRDAFGQLLEYAYFDTARQNSELFIIGRGIPTPETRSYLSHLRKRFGLEINYRQYKIGSHRLTL